MSRRFRLWCPCCTARRDAEMSFDREVDCLIERDPINTVGHEYATDAEWLSRLDSVAPRVCAASAA